MNLKKKSRYLLAMMSGLGVPFMASAMPAVPDSVYLFSYNADARNGLNFAWSAHKDSWKSIGSGYAFVKSDYGTWGAEKRMFAPDLLRMPDGSWRCVFQVNDRANQFAVAESKDLVKWQPQDYPYMEGVSSCLAPQLKYDKVSGLYQVFFKTREGDVYLTTSKDFYHFSRPQKVNSSAYLNNKMEAEVNGRKLSGQIFKVAYTDVQRMIQATESAAYWAVHALLPPFTSA